MTREPDVDVLVVGAGISGIGAGYWLQEKCPDRTYAILEGRDRIGGTWDLFRYPGVRSDSDMHTLGYSFKPWRDPRSIADGPSILAYVEETAAEFGIDRKIRFGHRVVRAEWRSADAQWHVHYEHGPDGVPGSMTCRFLFMCSGYYSYKQGYTPEFAGAEDFGGTIVHPQAWPEELDYTDKDVVVIGSGATAVTLVPAMADRTASITMLQRSPTWMVARPDHDPVAQRLRKVLPEKLAYAATRKKNTVRSEFFYNQTRSKPEKVRAELLKLAGNHLSAREIEANFTPEYDPWDQRLCLVPNADFFKAVSSGAASVVTAQIERFTAAGVQLTDGRTLPADIVVTATGLQLVTVGEMDFAVDGAPVDFSRAWTYRGVAYSDLPNLVSTFGYINASWTLRADLTSEFVCRLLNHMRATGTDVVTPRLRPEDADMTPRPWIDDFSSGYMTRMMPLLPRQGHEPWTNPQRYSIDRKVLRTAPLEDGALIFAPAPARQPA